MSIELECLTFVTIASLNLKRGVTRGDSGGASVAASSARGAVAAREGVSPPHAREWRARFGQHCHGWYLDGACPHLADARGCGFLHGDAEEEDP